MNLLKSKDYFSPNKVNGKVHIIGCGSVGSTIAELIARTGIKDICLYDFDTVSPHNIANQMFFDNDIGKDKAEVIKNLIISINPEAAGHVGVFDEGYTPDTKLDGYVFLCVDNIDLRREIVNANVLNRRIIAMFDTRTALEDAQHYAADWHSFDDIKKLQSTMDFTHAEARAAAPVTACNITISVAPTVRVICALAVSNFMNFINKGSLKRTILADPFNFDLISYD